MAESRGRKEKKAQWQIVLGVKQVVCGALGLAGVMLVIFVLGVLAGRGDVYRLMAGWGLLPPEARQVAQWPPPGEATPPGPPLIQPANPTAAAPGNAAVPAAAAVAGAHSAAPGAPVQGSIIPSPAPASAKKSKGISSHKDKKAKEEEMRRTRREVAPKLKFLNSLDTHKPPGVKTSKEKEKQKVASKAQPTQVRVGKFRDRKAAQAKVAELQKKGEKASLKQRKDQKGLVYYEVYRQAAAASAKGDKVAQSAPKTGENKAKSTH